MLRRTRVFATDLSFLSTISILEQTRQVAQSKVTRGHPQAPEVRERQVKSNEGSKGRPNFTNVAIITSGGYEISDL